MSNQLPTDYQAFIHKSRYAKYYDGSGRESWGDTVSRFTDNIIGNLVDVDTKKQLELAILSLDVMPSMRALMTSGIALDRCNVAGYN